MSEKLVEAVETIQFYLERVSSLLTEFEDMEDEEIAEHMSRINQVYRQTKDLWSDAQTAMVDKVEWTDKPIETTFSQVEIKSGAPRKSWDHEGLTEELIRRIQAKSIDIDTGERLQSSEDMMRELISHAGVSYWRVTGLKALDVDVDEYCEKGVSKKSVVIHRKD